MNWFQKKKYKTEYIIVKRDVFELVFPAVRVILSEKMQDWDLTKDGKWIERFSNLLAQIKKIEIQP